MTQIKHCVGRSVRLFFLHLLNTPFRRLYIISFYFVIVTIIIININNVKINYESLSENIIYFLLLIFSSFILSILMNIKGKYLYIFTRKFWLLLSYTALIVFVSDLGLTLNNLSFTNNFDYYDRTLYEIDKIMNISWINYYSYIMSHEYIYIILKYAYHQMFVIMIGVIFFILIVSKNELRAQFYVEAFFISSIIFIFVGLFFPARGVVHFYMENIASLPDFGFPVPGLQAVASMEAIRSESPSLFYGASFGLTTFPSFHTGGGIIFLWSVRRNIVFVPVAIYSLTMIAATPVFGGHYFIDLIAGIILQVAILLYWQNRPAYRGLFAADGSGDGKRKIRSAVGLGVPLGESGGILSGETFKGIDQLQGVDRR